MKATYIWQMINQVGRYFFFLIFEIFLWRFCAFLNKGSSKTSQNTFWESPCQKLLAEKFEGFFFPFICSHGVFVRFSTRGVQKHHKNFLGEVHVKNFWPKKLRKKNFFPVVCRLFPSIFLIAFLAVSLHEEPKNTIKIFSKIRPENRKKPQKR
jgi:hypothetical protein